MSPTRYAPPTPAELEASIEAYFNKTIRQFGGIPIKLAPTQKGLPDRLILMPLGRSYLVELKTYRGTRSAMQIFWHSRVADLGHEVYTIYGRTGIDDWVREVLGIELLRKKSR